MALSFSQPGELLIILSGQGSTEAVETTTEGNSAKEEQEAEEFKSLVRIDIEFWLCLITGQLFSVTTSPGLITSSHQACYLS